MALLVGLLAAWWLSRQLGGLRRYADAVTAGERTSLPRSAGEFADLGHALETMRERLEGKQYVEQYVHALTHELKSPLAAIRAVAELLESPLPETDRVRFTRQVGSQSDRMAQMVDKLLALAAVEHRQRIEHPQPVDLDALLQELAEAVAPRLQARELVLDIDAGPADCRVPGDAFLLGQLLRNLVDNAIDFSPRGGVVSVQVRAGEGEACIEIADRGPGVPEYAAERVFERFYSLPRPEGGDRSSGLGLNFAAEVAALHGGRVQLGNRDGGGALAQVTLPR